MVSASMCTLLSGVVTGLLSLEDSKKHQGTGVTETGIMDVVFDRLGNAKKQSIWNRRSWKVLSILLCSRYPTMWLVY